jgi:hypothetical protein
MTSLDIREITLVGQAERVYDWESTIDGGTKGEGRWDRMIPEELSLNLDQATKLVKAACDLYAVPMLVVEIAGPLGPNQAAYTLEFHNGISTIFLPETSYPEMVLHEFAHYLTVLHCPFEDTDEHGPFFVRFLVDLCNAFGVAERWYAEIQARAYGIEIATDSREFEYEQGLKYLEV